MKVMIVFDDDGVEITGEDFIIKGKNLFIYTIAKFLAVNAIQNSVMETDPLLGDRVISFDIEDKDLLLLNIEKSNI